MTTALRPPKGGNLEVTGPNLRMVAAIVCCFVLVGCKKEGASSVSSERQRVAKPSVVAQPSTKTALSCLAVPRY
jgi:hypothetical protein